MKTSNGRLIVFTGAGVSAESGVPTFRDAAGLWMGSDPNKVCNYSTWKNNFEDVHQFYNSLRASLETVSPNAAHYAIAEWVSLYPTTVFTQNVDDLFERAGVSPIKVHGDLMTMKCEACGLSVRYSSFTPGDQCQNHKCASRKGVKPNVVFFGEQAPRYRDLHTSIRRLTFDDVVVVMGTSSAVVDINSMLANVSATTVVNNLVPTPGDEIYDRTFYMPATEAAPQISEFLRTSLLVSRRQ